MCIPHCDAYACTFSLHPPTTGTGRWGTHARHTSSHRTYMQPDHSMRPTAAVAQRTARPVQLGQSARTVCGWQRQLTVQHNLSTETMHKTTARQSHWVRSHGARKRRLIGVAQKEKKAAREEELVRRKKPPRTGHTEHRPPLIIAMHSRRCERRPSQNDGRKNGLFQPRPGTCQHVRADER